MRSHVSFELAHRRQVRTAKFVSFELVTDVANATLPACRAIPGPARCACPLRRAAPTPARCAPAATRRGALRLRATFPSINGARAAGARRRRDEAVHVPHVVGAEGAVVEEHLLAGGERPSSPSLFTNSWRVVEADADADLAVVELVDHRREERLRLAVHQHGVPCCCCARSRTPRRSPTHRGRLLLRQPRPAPPGSARARRASPSGTR